MSIYAVASRHVFVSPVMECRVPFGRGLTRASEVREAMRNHSSVYVHAENIAELRRERSGPAKL